MRRPTLLASLLAAVLLALVASPAAADVTIRSQVTTTGPGSSQGETVSYLKGLKMRQEMGSGKDQTLTILDVQAKEMIVLEPRKERATVWDLSQISQQMSEIPETRIDAGVKPTGETKTIAGETCNVHDMRIVVSVEPGAGAGAIPMEFDVVMQGPACLVPDAPGADEYERFYQAMADAGLFLGHPSQAQAQPGQQKGFTELYRQMAEKGLPYHSKLDIEFEGSGFMARMLNKFSATSETTVTSVSTDPIPDSLFQVPSGYDVKRQD